MTDSEHMVVGGFTVVPVKFDKTRTTVQYIYLKQHHVRRKETEQVKPSDRTIFVGNSPPWATKKSFEQIFSCCGKVEQVYFHNKPCSGKTDHTESTEHQLRPEMDHRVAYVVFGEKEAVSKALRLSYNKPLVLSTKASPIIHGCTEYKQMYLASQQKDVSQLKEQITRRIMDYDRKQKIKEKKLKEAEPDEEGWTVVTRVGKNKGAPRTEMEDTRVKQKEGKKRKKKELSNFYSFQTREEKKRKIEELRQQFELDRSKVEVMKSQRKFKPF